MQSVDMKTIITKTKHNVLLFIFEKIVDDGLAYSY